ncbi:MAG: hypothetical protein EBZ76_09735 [Synechococcaceae bacterium WB9_2_170]|nr:hypothetical protein [Synechococcaceae bacterium WB9_2_170]
MLLGLERSEQIVFQEAFPRPGPFAWVLDRSPPAHASFLLQLKFFGSALSARWLLRPARWFGSSDGELVAPSVRWGPSDF